MAHNQSTTCCPTPAFPKPGLLWLPIACAWLLMLVTISPPDRGTTVIGSMDIFAFAKLSVRLLVLGVLMSAMFIWWQRRHSFAAVRWYLPFAGFVGFAILSTVWSPLKSVSLGQSASFCSLVILSISFALFCRDIDDLSRVLKHLTTGVIALCAIILFCYFCVPQMRALQRAAVDGLLNPTNAAATAALGLILLTGSCLIWNWRWAHALLLPGLCLCGLVLVLALNRWAPTVTIPLLVILFVRSAGRTLLFGSVLAASILGVLYLAADPGMYFVDKAVAATTETASRGQSKKQLSAYSGREILWVKMQDSFDESPWIGHGYFVTSSTGLVKVWDVRTNITAHNFLLQVLVTTGVVGTALLLFALLSLAVKIWFDLIKKRGNTSFGLFCGILACWYVCWGLMNSSIAGPLQPESVVFFTVLGAAVGLCRQSRTEATIA